MRETREDKDDLKKNEVLGGKRDLTQISGWTFKTAVCENIFFCSAP